MNNQYLIDKLEEWSNIITEVRLRNNDTIEEDDENSLFLIEVDMLELTDNLSKTNNLKGNWGTDER